MSGTADPLLREVSRLAVEWSATCCAAAAGRGTGCDWYHAAWPLLRLAGTVSGAHGEGAFFKSALPVCAAGFTAPRVLICGAADHAMQDIVIDALDDKAAASSITVVDRCETPLRINRLAAERSGRRIDTITSEILDLKGDAAFDIITTHSILSFVTPAQRKEVFSVWHRLLAPGGWLVLSQAYRPQQGQDAVRWFDEREIEEFVHRCRSALALAGEDGWIDPSAAGEMFRRFARNKFAHVVADAEQIVADLTHCGLAVKDLTRSSRVQAGHGSASPDAPGSIDNLRIVARRVAD